MKYKLQDRVRIPKKDNAKKIHTEPQNRKSHWKLIFGSSSETDSTDTDADMHSLSSADHCSDEGVDSLKNELWPILSEIEVTLKDDFVLVKFESSILAVQEKEYEVKFLHRTRGELFVHAKIDDTVRIYEKFMEVILYVNNQVKTMVHQSNIVHFCRLSNLFPQLIMKQH